MKYSSNNFYFIFNFYRNVGIAPGPIVSIYDFNKQKRANDVNKLLNRPLPSVCKNLALPLN